MSVSRRVAPGMLLALAACHASAGDPPVSDSGVVIQVPDASGPIVDAAPPAPDAKLVDCPAGLPSSYGDLGSVTTVKNMINGTYNVFRDLNLDPRQLLAINLYPDRGIFAGGVVPGTYEIKGDDTDYQTCSLCIQLFADYAAPPALELIAEKGFLVIDSVSGEQVSGHLTDISLRPFETVYDGAPCGDINDPICGNTSCLNNHCGRQSGLVGCKTSITNMQF